MASTDTNDHANNGILNKETNPTGFSSNGAQSGPDGSSNGPNVVNGRQWDYGGNPLAHVNTGDSARLPAFGGYAQPGLFKPPTSKIGNPAPLGLAAFALTTFVLSLINWHTRDVTEANIIVSLAFGYGGLVQLLAGMWEMAIGNTFGATALSSYGGFWISFAIVLTPGGFNIVGSYSDPQQFNFALGFFLMGWFIFTFILWICTLKSTVAFSMIFGTLWITFLLLGVAYLYTPDGSSVPHEGCQKAGGMFGLLSAFSAWWNALAGLADDSNSFFIVPVLHFPWSEKGRQNRAKKADDLEARKQE